MPLPRARVQRTAAGGRVRSAPPCTRKSNTPLHIPADSCAGPTTYRAWDSAPSSIGVVRQSGSARKEEERFVRHVLGSEKGERENISGLVGLVF